MDQMKSLVVIKCWMSLTWHNLIKIDVVEKLANFDVNFEGEGVEIPENSPGSARKEKDVNFPNIKLDFSFLVWFAHKLASKLTYF